MSDPKQNTNPSPAAAETARQEGAQGQSKAPGDTVSDGEVDASDPAMAPKIESAITDVADEVHANA